MPGKHLPRPGRRKTCIGLNKGLAIKSFTISRNAGTRASFGTGRRIMLSKKMVVFAAVGALLAFASTAWAATDDEVIGITGAVDTFADWSSGNNTTIASGDFSSTVNLTGEDITVSRPLALYANVTVTITATGTANSGIATNGTDTMTTSYKLTGAEITTPDAAWKAAGTAAGEFFNVSNSYEVVHTGGDGAYSVTLEVQLESADTRAQDAGDYTCQVTLTATW